MLRTLAVAGLILGGLCGSAVARQWLDKKQGKRFEAEFVRVVDGKAVFMRGGRTQTMPLADLIEKDVEFIRHEMESRGKPWLVAAPESLRTWTDTQGRSNSAMFVRMVGRDVLLGNPKGTYQVPFELLSAADQEFVRQELTAQGKADQLPAELPDVAAARHLATTAAEAKEKPDSAGPAMSASANGPTAAKGPAVETVGSELASLKPPAAPSGNSVPPADTSGANAPQQEPTKADKPTDDASSMLDAPSSASAQKPAAKPSASTPAPAPPPAAASNEPKPTGYPYCSRCKRATPGKNPGDPCGGCGLPLDLFQNLDGSIEEVAGQGFWAKYGIMIILGAVAVCGLVAFSAWKSGGND